jgi:hypothetical protein
MRKILLILMTISTLLVCPFAFADTASSPSKSVSRSAPGTSGAYWYAHAAGIMHLLLKQNPKLTYAQVVSLIKSK